LGLKNLNSFRTSQSSCASKERRNAVKRSASWLSTSDAMEAMLARGTIARKSRMRRQKMMMTPKKKVKKTTMPRSRR